MVLFLRWVICSCCENTERKHPNSALLGPPLQRKTMLVEGFLRFATYLLLLIFEDQGSPYMTGTQDVFTYKNLSVTLPLSKIETN